MREKTIAVVLGEGVCTCGAAEHIAETGVDCLPRENVWQTNQGGRLLQKICPKCGSDMGPGLMMWVWGSAGRNVRHKGPKLTGYVCVSCRYVEFWQEGE